VDRTFTLRPDRREIAQRCCGCAERLGERNIGVRKMGARGFKQGFTGRLAEGGVARQCAMPEAYGGSGAWHQPKRDPDAAVAESERGSAAHQAIHMTSSGRTRSSSLE